MKQLLLTSLTCLLCCFCVFSAPKSTIIKEILEEHVSNKVEKMQELIKFDDRQREQLLELELNFLLNVQEAETCVWCNSQKKIEKLQHERKQALQKILTREQFLKYDAIENKRIKKGVIRAEDAF